jgi:hypothetical protein
MSASFDTHHLKSSKDLGTWEDSDKPKVHRVMACGVDSMTDYYKLTKDPDTEPSCSKCSAAWAKAKLKVQPNLRIEPETVGNISQWKSMNRAYIGDELIAFIAVENGWGKRWFIYELGVFEDKIARNSAIKKSYHSKFAALLALPALHVAGTLPGEQAVLKNHAEQREKLVATRARMAQARVEEEAELKMAIEGLEGLTADTSRLSNAERAAVLFAIGRLRQG